MTSSRRRGSREQEEAVEVVHNEELEEEPVGGLELADSKVDSDLLLILGRVLENRGSESGNTTDSKVGRLVDLPIWWYPIWTMVSMTRTFESCSLNLET
jgi:hypothetical protein